MRNGVRHSIKLAARVGRQYPFVCQFFSSLHHFILYAYSFITPPCFYSPGNEFHISLDDQIEAITVSLQHKQRKLIKNHQEKRLKMLLISFVLLLLAFKQHHQAHASSDSTNLGVSASVAPKCKILSTNMAFGTYDPQNNANLDVNGNVVLSCTKNTSATIGMNTGANASQASGGATRSMHNTSTNGNGNSSYMSYELYKNAGRTSVWSTASPLAITATSAAQISIPIYGRVPQGQNVQDGGYVDTVVVTVNF